MSTFRVVGLAGVVVASVAVGVVVASASNGPSNGSVPNGAVPQGAQPVNVDIKHARAAAVVDAGGTFVGVKGFDRITHPQVGIYCLRLSDRTLNAARLAPMVTVEWGNSSGDDLLANWYRAGPECPNTGRYLEILTFDEAVAGTWGFSDDVGFAVVVP